MKKFIALIAVCLPVLTFSQQGVHSSGGEASGSGGSVSYSVGQLFYHVHYGADAFVAEGVQQPYEISVITVVEEAEDISLLFRTYPNPVSDFLVLETTGHETGKLRYQLFDMKGMLLQEQQVVDAQTTIPMRGYDPAVYFLRLTRQNEVIKTFRILKNQ